MATAVCALREKIGDEAMGGLQAFVDDARREWKNEVLTLTTERFDRRLGEGIGALRLDLAKAATLRAETAKDFAALRGEMAETRFSMLKWAFVFWIGQFAAVSAMMALLLRTTADGPATSFGQRPQRTRRYAAVHEQRLPGDVLAGIGREKHDRAFEILGLPGRPSGMRSTRYATHSASSYITLF